jgi:hypothetical protein
MCGRSDQYVASAASTREPLLRRDPIGEEVPWVDLASVGQLDLPPSTDGMIGDKKLGFGNKKKLFCVLTIGMPSIGHVPSYI